MHPKTRTAFVEEMRKLASEHELKPSKNDAVVAETARLGVMGGSLGAYGVTTALLKSDKQPSSLSAMLEHVDRIAHEMKLPSAVGVHVPEKGFESWNPAFFPDSGTVRIPLKVRDAVIAHELGHAKNDQLLSQMGKGIKNAYNSVQDVSRGGSGIAVGLTSFLAATDEKMSYKPGVIQAILSTPMVAEEIAASARATAHLIREHGVGKGIVKSLPLAPALATYLAVAGAPALITYLRRRAALKEREGAEKTAARDEDGLSFFERHPKKILGGALVAGGVGLALKGKKMLPLAVKVTKPAAAPVAKKAVVPAKASVKKVVPEWDQATEGPSRPPGIQAYRRDTSKPVQTHQKGRHLELQDKAKMDRALEDEVVRATSFAQKHAMAKLAARGDGREEATAKGVGALGIGGVAALGSKPLITGRTRLYHGTTDSNAKRIVQEGLLPASHGGVLGVTEILDPTIRSHAKDLAYMTSKPSEARMYASQARALAEMRKVNPNANQRNVLNALQEVRATPQFQLDILNPFNKKGIVAADVPLWKEEMMNRLTKNPEARGSFEEFRKGSKNLFDFRPAIEKYIEDRAVYKSLKDSKVFRQGVPAEYIRGSSKFQGLTLKEIGQYAKARPGRFAAGASLGVGGLAAGAYGAKKLYDALKRQKSQK